MKFRSWGGRGINVYLTSGGWSLFASAASSSALVNRVSMWGSIAPYKLEWEIDAIWPCSPGSEFLFCHLEVILFSTREIR